jgi:hypothetical protein
LAPTRFEGEGGGEDVMTIRLPRAMARQDYVLVLA